MSQALHVRVSNATSFDALSDHSSLETAPEKHAGSYAFQRERKGKPIQTPHLFVRWPIPALTERTMASLGGTLEQLDGHWAGTQGTLVLPLALPLGNFEQVTVPQFPPVRGTQWCLNPGQSARCWKLTQLLC